MMSMRTALGCATCLLAIAVVNAKTAVLTDEVFDEIVGGETPSIVEFYAPWCGHCKTLKPEWEKLETAYGSTEKVIIGNLDADQYKVAAGKYGVSGFPTIKFFPGNGAQPKDYTGERNAKSLTEFVNKETGLKVQIKTVPSAVTVLTSANFDAIVLSEDKNVFVEFFAPWCGHCKALTPTYEKVAQSFFGDPSIVIASVEATEYRDLATRFDVSGYPTLRWFPKGDKQGISYDKGRKAEDFVEFINAATGSHRTVGGGFTDEAVPSEAIKNLVMDFTKVDNTEKSKLEVIQKAETAVKSAEGPYAKYAKFYPLAMKKMMKLGSDYIVQETARLDRLMNGKIKEDKKIEFLMRQTILKQFSSGFSKEIPDKAEL